MIDPAFRGESLHKVDQKGRVSIPAEFRQIIALGDPEYRDGNCPRFTVVYGDQRLGCLKCYTEQVIGNIDSQISELPRSSRERQFLQHYFQTRSVRVQLDPTGRLLMSMTLREKVSRADQVCFAGTGDSFEIWSLEAYEQHRRNLESLFHDGDSALDPMSLLEDAH